MFALPRFTLLEGGLAHCTARPATGLK